MRNTARVACAGWSGWRWIATFDNNIITISWGVSCGDQQRSWSSLCITA